MAAKGDGHCKWEAYSHGFKRYTELYNHYDSCEPINCHVKWDAYSIKILHGFFAILPF